MIANPLPSKTMSQTLLRNIVACQSCHFKCKFTNHQLQCFWTRPDPHSDSADINSACNVRHAQCPFNHNQQTQCNGSTRLAPLKTTFQNSTHVVMVPTCLEKSRCVFQFVSEDFGAIEHATVASSSVSHFNDPATKKICCILCCLPCWENCMHFFRI